jgi:hypothetical protein
VNARAAAVAGAVAGLLGALMFATLHAIIIVPIWDRMVMGLAFGTGAGAAAGWAFGELRTEPSPRAGLAFGAWLFASTIPVTLVAAALRSSGFVEQHRDVADAIAVVLAVAGGAAIGWMRGRRARAAVSMAVAALCLTMAMGGPVPALRGARAGGIYIAVLIASLGGGALLGFISRRRQHQSGEATASS